MDVQDGDQFPIRGFWIFRGNDIPPMMKEECYDLDLYNWSKVDINDEVSRDCETANGNWSCA